MTEAGREGEGSDLWSAPYEPKSEEEIFRVAQGIYDGTCIGTWGEWAYRNPDMIPTVFMAVVFGGLPPEQWVRDNKIVHFYEWIDKASPRAINGMPNFFSHHIISHPDMEKVVEKYEAIKLAMDAIRPKPHDESKVAS